MKQIPKPTEQAKEKGVENGSKYGVYVLAEIGQINDSDGNKSRGVTRNIPTNLVSQ